VNWPKWRTEGQISNFWHFPEEGTGSEKNNTKKKRKKKIFGNLSQVVGLGVHEGEEKRLGAQPPCVHQLNHLFNQALGFWVSLERMIGKRRKKKKKKIHFFSSKTATTHPLTDCDSCGVVLAAFPAAFWKDV